MDALPRQAAVLGTPHCTHDHSSFIDVVALATSCRERISLLRAHESEFSNELVEEFRRRAHGEIRTDPLRAARIARTGADIARWISDHEGRIACLSARAQACLIGGRFHTTLRTLSVIGAISSSSPDSSAGTDRLRTARLDTIRMQAFLHLERYEEARRIGERALRAFSHDSNGAIRVLMSLADLEFRLDRPRKALAYYQTIEGLLPADAAPRIRGALAANRGNALEACNRLNAAARQFEIARRLFSEAGCEHTVAQVDYNAAYAEALGGHYEESLKRYAGARKVFEKVEDERHLAHIDLDRAEIHLHLNMPEDARELAILAEKRFRTLGLKKECAQSADLAGQAAMLTGESEQAEALLRRAEELFLALGLTERRARCMVKRACLAEKEGRFDEALRLADRAEAVFVKSTSQLASAEVRLLRCRVDLAAGRPEDALGRVNTVLQDCRHIHAPWVAIEANRIKGRAEALLGNGSDAIRSYQRAVLHLEGYRGGVPPDEYMSAFLAGRAALYGEFVELLVKNGRPDFAFEIAEGAKCRALVDLLAGRKNSLPREVGANTAPTRLRHLREKLTASYRRLFKHSADADSRSLHAVRDARAQAVKLEGKLTRILREDRLARNEDDGPGGSMEVDIATIRENLDEDTILVEYFLSDHHLTAFVVSKEKTEIVRHRVNEYDLEPLIRRFQFHIARVQGPHLAPDELLLRATRANLERLSGILIEPIASELDCRRLVIVPHGILHRVPFHALPWGDGWVSDRFEVLYAPSAALYVLCGRAEPSAEGPPCVLALPDEYAPRIDDEAREVAKALSTDHLYIGEQATLGRLEEEVREARIVHIAAHGMFRHAQPMLSAIRLADRWMNLYDVYGLDVRGELVVLSACESGTAEVTDGDEILGLTRGFLYAGAPALLTSQWPVNDAVTTEFMSCFYKHLGEFGDVAAAHQRAMAEIRESHPHPYFWAPFFLMGRPVSKRSPASDEARSEMEPVAAVTERACS